MASVNRDGFTYDVCLSFAGEQRGYVEEVAEALSGRGIRVFYDLYERAALWGKDLYTHLDFIYREAAIYCVIFVSHQYATKVWPSHELKSAQARALGENDEYILPVKFDDTELPGLRPTIAYIELADVTPDELASLIEDKLRAVVGPWPGSGPAGSGQSAHDLPSGDQSQVSRATSPVPQPTAAASGSLSSAFGGSKATGPGDRPAWVTEANAREWHEVVEFFREVAGRRTWALIELSAMENARQRTSADAIIVHLVSEREAITTYRVPCAVNPEDSDVTPEEAVLRALRDAVEMLLDRQVMVDLCLPRLWLDAGMEDWPVVRVGDRYESMANHYDTRLRWSMYRHNPRLRARLVRRRKAVDLTRDPYAIPVEITSDPVRFREWLHDRNEKDTADPPYFTGTSPANDDYDPLGLLLREGYGFVVWFTSQGTGDEAAVAACARAARLGVGVGSAGDRLDNLPRLLAAEFRSHRPRPVIVWDDPDGREDFLLPAPRFARRRLDTR